MELTFKTFFSEEEAFDQKKASHIIKLLSVISLIVSFVFSFWTTGSVRECLRIGFGFWFGFMLVFLVIYLLRSCVPTHPLQFANSWMIRDIFYFGNRIHLEESTVRMEQHRNDFGLFL